MNTSLTHLTSHHRLPVEISDSLDMTDGVTGKLTFQEVADDKETTFQKSPSGVVALTRRASALRNGVRT